MYVGDRDTRCDVFCQECEKNECRSASPKGDAFFCIADKDTLNSLGLCEDCASPLANIVTDTEATLDWLKSIIPQLPPGRAEYTTLPTKNFPDRIYDTIIDRLDELKAQGIIGYRKSEKSISILLHQRNN